MARKVVAQAPAQRRSGLNRAQLKAIAAQQAMANAPARPATRPDSGEQAATHQPEISGLSPSRRRVDLSLEQEYAYIRSDIVRLVIVAAILLVVLVVTLSLLR